MHPIKPDRKLIKQYEKNKIIIKIVGLQIFKNKLFI